MPFWYKKMYCLLVFTLCFAPHAGSSSMTYTFGVAEENIGALDYQQDQFTGKMAASTDCILQQVGRAFNVVTAPHARLLKMLKAGQIDVAAPLIKTHERDQYAQYIGPLDPITMWVVFPEEYESPTSAAFKKHVKKYGYVVKRGTRVSPHILETIGLDAQDISHVEQQVLTFSNAINMVKKRRAACTLVPEVLLSQMQPEDLSKVNYVADVTLHPSFYVAHARAELRRLFVQAARQCKNKSTDEPSQPE